MNTIQVQDVFGSRGRVAALRVLANVAVPLSIRQVAVQAGMSHAATGDALDSLVSAGLVAATDAGRSRVHWLERRNLFVREMVLPVFAFEAEAAEAVIGELRASIPADVFSAVLFGSRARGVNAVDSDFDVVVVERDRVAVDRTLKELDKATTDLRAALGASVSVLGYTLSEALDLVRRGDNFMGGVVRDGITLVGVSPQAWGKSDEGASGHP